MSSKEEKTDNRNIVTKVIDTCVEKSEDLVFRTILPKIVGELKFKPYDPEFVYDVYCFLPAPYEFKGQDIMDVTLTYQCKVKGMERWAYTVRVADEKAAHDLDVALLIFAKQGAFGVTRKDRINLAKEQEQIIVRAKHDLDKELKKQAKTTKQ